MGTEKRGSTWDRPSDIERVHFSINGTIALMEEIDQKHMRAGDTAGALTPDWVEPRIWLCMIGPDETGLIWWNLAPWSQEDADACIARADLVICLFETPTETPSREEDTTLN